MAKRKIEKDYHELAKSRGFNWIGKKLPKGTGISTVWQCKKCNYSWKAPYSRIQQGTGCPQCAGVAKKIEKDYYNLAERRGFVWIGKKLPKNTQIGTLWECKKCKHRWKIKYFDIQQGSGCPCCAGILRKTKQDYYNLVINKNIIWVGSTLPKKINIKTSWKCKKCGYTWKTRYNNIQQGGGCPKCAGKIKKVEKDYHTLVLGRDIIWIGETLPKNIHTKTLWECKKCGYRWKAQYSNIYSGRECPKCKNIVNGSRVSQLQVELNKLLNGYLNYPEARYRIDVATVRDSQKIAVEYDAQYWHQNHEERDAERDKYLISCGWKVLHIKSGKLLPTRKQLKKAINKLLNGQNLVNIYLDDWKTA